jgi:hypothetical protein
VWRRLLSGFNLDGVARNPEAEQVTQPAVEETLAALRH